MTSAVTALPAAGPWRRAVVREVRHPFPRAVVLRLDVADRTGHLPGQHVVVRLTAEDGYTASRSYSIASAPSDPLLELFVEELAEGEVSPYLAGAVEAGDELEVRGPIGGWFVWDGRTPAVGIGGGSGVVPLVAMLRHGRDLGTSDRLRLAVAARTLATLPYAAELTAAGAVTALSREVSPTGRAAGRLNPAAIAPLVNPDATYFICGSAAFAAGASDLLTGLGVDPASVRVERFGASG
ncbi:FAD-binding oxidoreductase [uncultured Friedmanniella sp.]|uniref:FAD-binding oxidoreductase n=1 Tax=uncultured Friedmanniella sp. TaxID=335381 RepID=UPI0035CC9D70